MQFLKQFFFITFVYLSLSEFILDKHAILKIKHDNFDRVLKFSFAGNEAVTQRDLIRLFRNC